MLHLANLVILHHLVSYNLLRVPVRPAQLQKFHHHHNSSPAMTFQATPGSALLQHALASGRFDQIAEILDDTELQIVDLHLPQDWPYTVHLLGHLYNFSLEDARFLWKRTPADRKQDAELLAAFGILQQLWNKDYEATWTVLSSFAWSPVAAPLAAGLAVRVRERTLAVLSAAYATISPGRVAAFLGLPSEAEAIALTQQSGWELDASTGLLKVHRPAAESTAVSPEQHLERLTEYMLHIESEPRAEATGS